MNTLKVLDGDGLEKWLKVIGAGTELDPFRNVYVDTPRRLFFQYADTVGDGTGSESQNVDGSVTPVLFYIKPMAGEKINVSKVITGIVTGGVSMKAMGWGNESAMTNGIELIWKSDGVLIPLNTIPIKSHFDLAMFNYTLQLHDFGTGDDFLVAEYNIRNSGVEILLDGDLGDEIQIKIQDDLSGLDDQKMFFQGYYDI